MTNMGTPPSHAYTRAIGSQSEIPVFSHQEDASCLVQGYQYFRAGARGLYDSKPEHEKKFAAIAPFIHLLRNKRFIDFGCSSGYFGIQALLHGTSFVSFVDHDPEYLAIAQNVLHYLELTNWECICSTVSAVTDIHDVGFALALVHWIYSYSDTFGSLQAIVAHLAKLASHTLFIEWIDPTDYAMALAGHLQQNPGRIRQPYTKKNFLKALRMHYPTVELLAAITPTRELYIATLLENENWHDRDDQLTNKEEAGAS